MKVKFETGRHTAVYSLSSDTYETLIKLVKLANVSVDSVLNNALNSLEEELKRKE